jgi:hypothetical protein
MAETSAGLETLRCSTRIIFGLGSLMVCCLYKLSRNRLCWLSLAWKRMRQLIMRPLELALGAATRRALEVELEGEQR